MAASGFKWDVAPSIAFPQLVERYTNTIFLAGRRVAARRAEEGAAWMRGNAPWTDRTGRARAGLHVDVLESPGVLAELVFSHDDSLEYPVWLELANGGRYAIIAPAIDHFGPLLMRDIQRIMNLGLAAK
jgi:hypothetical protein